ncbi:GspH/FimT family pseudopilin [Bordetella bronchialis]|uniref:GspH/FimT family pseudopilin n=1 Tax=Bordetella bronchialis TaxID=463025 RepID=UPI003CFBD497
MMVVVAIIAIVTTAAGLSQPKRDDQPLARDARRLSLLFALAQTEARAGWRAIRWHTDGQGYRFTRPPPWTPGEARAQVSEAPPPDDFQDDESLRPRRWEAANVHVRMDAPQAAVFLPEWIAPPMRIELSDDFQRIAIVRDASGRYALQQ